MKPKSGIPIPEASRKTKPKQRDVSSHRPVTVIGSGETEVAVNQQKADGNDQVPASTAVNHRKMKEQGESHSHSKLAYLFGFGKKHKEPRVKEEAVKRHSFDAESIDVQKTQDERSEFERRTAWRNSEKQGTLSTKLVRKRDSSSSRIARFLRPSHSAQLAHNLPTTSAPNGEHSLINGRETVTLTGARRLPEASVTVGDPVVPGRTTRATVAWPNRNSFADQSSIGNSTDHSNFTSGSAFRSSTRETASLNSSNVFPASGSVSPPATVIETEADSDMVTVTTATTSDERKVRIETATRHVGTSPYHEALRRDVGTQCEADCTQEETAVANGSRKHASLSSSPQISCKLHSAHSQPEQCRVECSCTCHKSDVHAVREDDGPSADADANANADAAEKQPEVENCAAATMLDEEEQICELPFSVGCKDEQVCTKRENGTLQEQPTEEVNWIKVRKDEFETLLTQMAELKQYALTLQTVLIQCASQQ